MHDITYFQFLFEIGMDLGKTITIEKSLDLPNWDSLCRRRITADHLKTLSLFAYLFSMLENEITKHYAKKFEGLSLKNNKKVNRK